MEGCWDSILLWGKQISARVGWMKGTECSVVRREWEVLRAWEGMQKMPTLQEMGLLKRCLHIYPFSLNNARQIGQGISSPFYR
jgi:hypothetical protein